MIDAGAVRLELPDTWTIEYTEDSVRVHDRPPPDDDCVLAVSYHRWPAIGHDLSAGSLVRSALENDLRTVTIDEPVVEENKIDIRLAWAQGRFTDARTHREACTRLCLARKAEVQAILTLDFWASDLARCHGYWTGFVSTLELAQRIDDPLRGPSLS